MNMVKNGNRNCILLFDFISSLFSFKSQFGTIGRTGVNVQHLQHVV